MASAPDSKIVKTNWRLDLTVAILVTVLGTLALVSVDAFERLHQFLEAHEEAELDEIFLGFGLLLLSLAWFAWRCWRNDVAHRMSALQAQINETKQADAAAHASEAQLRGAIDAMTEGFALFDEDERLVLCNAKYRETVPGSDSLGVLTPGTTFEEILRAGAEKGFFPTTYRDGEHYVTDRLKRLRNPSGPFEFLTVHGQWIRVDERKIDGGGTVTIRTNITASKHAEDALKENEARLRDAIDTMSEGFALFDSDERLVICNEPYRDTLPRLNKLGILEPGISFEEIVRTGIRNGFTPAFYQSDSDFLKSRMEKFRNPTGPVEYSTSNGQWIRFEERKTANGGTVGIRTDITERKQVEEALKASEANLRSIVDNYPYVITLKDLERRHILVNDAYAKSRGMSAAQAIGTTTKDNETPQQEAMVALHDQEVIDKRETVLKERETNRLNGEKVTRAIIKFPTFDFDGQLTGIGTISTDVSALKQAEVALRDSETLLKSIIDNMPSAIIVKNVEGQYILVNKVFEEWYGISSETALGKTTHDLFPKDFADIFTATDNASARLQKTEIVETDFPFENSDLEKIVSTKFFIPGADGNAMFVGTIATDITQQRKSEELLRQAQKMEAVGQLTGGIAHDFNNILGVVIGNLDFLQDSLSDDAEKLLIVDNAVRAALRGADLTQRLLAFARKQTLVPEIVDLNQLVLGMTELLRRTLGETITIVPNVAEGLWPTEIDPAQFESALLNLATNARHAMTEGGRLVIETDNVLLDQDYAAQHDGVIPGPHVMLAVSDTGVGMTDDVLAHAFDPFFTTKAVGEGSGLGLSMVHGFMRQSQGHVSVYSELSVGTTVKLYFKARPNAEAEADIVVSQNSISPSALLNETILVVEDDPDLRQLTVSIISHLGYQVLEAENGPSALAILAEETPIDLLFTDVILPDNMNGAELAAKAQSQRPSLKVLYTSGYNENVIVHNGMLDKDIELISKPYRRQELAQRIRQILDAPSLSENLDSNNE